MKLPAAGGIEPNVGTRELPPPPAQPPSATHGPPPPRPSLRTDTRTQPAPAARGSPACAPRSVRVVRGVGGQLQVDDRIAAGDVEAARRHVAHQKNAQPACARGSGGRLCVCVCGVGGGGGYVGLHAGGAGTDGRARWMSPGAESRRSAGCMWRGGTGVGAGGWGRQRTFLEGGQCGLPLLLAHFSMEAAYLNAPRRQLGLRRAAAGGCDWARGGRGRTDRGAFPPAPVEERKRTRKDEFQSASSNHPGAPFFRP